MTKGEPSLALSRPYRFSRGQRSRSYWHYALGAATGVAALFLLFDGRIGHVNDLQRRACLEPVYAGLFGTGRHALERCLTQRPLLFGKQDALWLRYVRHLEKVCPASIGMQGQAICEFQVKTTEDHTNRGWRSGRY